MSSVYREISGTFIQTLR